MFHSVWFDEYTALVRVVDRLSESARELARAIRCSAEILCAAPIEAAAYPILWCAPRAMSDEWKRRRRRPTGRVCPAPRPRRVAHAGHEDYG